jgi:hypothetical protein
MSDEMKSTIKLFITVKIPTSDQAERVWFGSELDQPSYLSA